MRGIVEFACVGKVLQKPARLLQHLSSEALNTDQTRRRKTRRPVLNEPMSFTEFCNNECLYTCFLQLMLNLCDVLNCRISVIIID